MAEEIIVRYFGLRRVMTICAAICGMNVLNPRYRLNIITRYLLIAVNCFFLFTLYTVHVSYYKEGDWTVILQNLCTVGTAVQGFVKLVTLIGYKKKFVLIFGMLEAIFKEYQQKNSEYRGHLTKTLDSIKKVVISFVFMYTGVVIAVILCPVYFFFVHNRRLLMLQILFPGINPDTDVGYFTLNAIHLHCVFFGAFGNFAGDMFLIYPICSMSLFKNILASKFHDMNEMLAQQTVDRRETMKALKDTVHWHQEYLIFLATCKSAFYWVVLIQIVTSCCAVAFSIVCVLLDRWPGGQVYLVNVYIVMMVYCTLGTLVDKTNDGIVDALYTEIMWYKLNVPEKRMLRMMLMMSQNTSGLLVGGVAPLNMQMALQLTKTIYTFTMMFVNFLYG